MSRGWRYNFYIEKRLCQYSLWKIKKKGRKDVDRSQLMLHSNCCYNRYFLQVTRAYTRGVYYYKPCTNCFDFILKICTFKKRNLFFIVWCIYFSNNNSWTLYIGSRSYKYLYLTSACKGHAFKKWNTFESIAKTQRTWYNIFAEKGSNGESCIPKSALK